ncbi:hypothetical protein EDD15DRAFT_2302283 [Pisolithus albus]|nr:hypothetical protein EDD15DRAFT_2302283 [Pisolithus albus]
MASPLRLLSVELQGTNDAESIELVVDGGVSRHQLDQNQERRGTFYKSFYQPLTFVQLSISVRPQKQTPHGLFTIGFDDVVSKLQGNGLLPKCDLDRALRLARHHLQSIDIIGTINSSSSKFYPNVEQLVSRVQKSLLLQIRGLYSDVPAFAS